MKHFVCTLALIFSFYVSYAQNVRRSNIYVGYYVDLITWFNPHLGNAYIQYPFVGSGKVSNCSIVHGSVKSYKTKKTEFQDIYLYHSKSTNHYVERCDTILNVICEDYFHDFPKSKNDKHINRDYLDTINVYKQTFPIADQIANCSYFDVINDSTFYYADYGWTFIITPKHRALITGNENDLWNIDILFNSKGLPVKVSRGGIIETYDYIDFDRFNNWTSKKITRHDGSTYIFERKIKYSCDKCGGKGYYEDICRKCLGTGQCRPNRLGGPDESVGICPSCHGSGTRSNLICEKCQKIHMK